ncbi:MAG: NAD(P)/FAD-dependent oxidoreductase, partial [Rhodanobacter sp.]
GGMAGAAAAANLAPQARVLVLERESQPGYHSTGRSAALFSESYGSAAIRALTRASYTFFHSPPAGFSAVALVSPRGVLYVASAEQVDALTAYADLPDVAAVTQRISPAQAYALSPCLREGSVVAALHEPRARDIDVDALHQGYLRQLRQCGGKLVNSAGVESLQHHDELWSIGTAAGNFRAKVVVNAAGAWVDEVAKLAGAAAVTIQPLRRTACMIDAPAGCSIESWPMTMDISESYYFKPDAGRLLLSPADSTPSPPCDAWPDDMDVAIAVDRIEQATTLSINHVKQKWAGLRSFVSDRNPVIGYDAGVPAFFWIAALGGYGIQTAPAVGRLAAALIQHQSMPDDLLTLGLDLDSIAPQRFNT